MENLLSESISSNPTAKILVVFGGDINRRAEIIKLLLPIENLTIYGTLSEQEGLSKIQTLNTIDIVLIGGRYTELQRGNIKAIVSSNYPLAQITEPGIGYHYSNKNIFSEINNLAKDETTSKI